VIPHQGDATCGDYYAERTFGIMRGMEGSQRASMTDAVFCNELWLRYNRELVSDLIMKNMSQFKK